MGIRKRHVKTNSDDKTEKIIWTKTKKMTPSTTAV